MSEIFILLAVVVALAWPLGRYLAVALGDAPSRVDRVFGPVERLLYRVMGVDPARGMSWRGVALAFVASNVVLAVIVQLILMFQHLLPLNPDGIPGMSWDLALHTMVSFLTNTNQQHYSGQAQLSYFSQLAGIVTLQVVTPAMGLAIGLAVLRGLFGGRNAGHREGRRGPRPRQLLRRHHARRAARVPAADAGLVAAADLAGRAEHVRRRENRNARRRQRRNEANR